MATPATNLDGNLLPGLSGNSWRDSRHQNEVHRLTPEQPIPFVNRQREFRILRKLRYASLGTLAKRYHSEILTVSWVEGKALSAQQFTPYNLDLVALLLRLHRQPLLGYRLEFVALLQRYWQLCRQHNPIWLKQLQRLQRQGEPHPLRLVPLHMDLHPGNVIETMSGLALIDWEYSTDGDIALELATLCLQDPSDSAAWISAYAQGLTLDPSLLARQVRRWQPWLQLLQASWYQLRAEQTGLTAMKQLAAESWRHLLLS